MLSSKEIRETFINYFKDNEHKYVKSSSLIPKDDDSILFVNSGMCQFKKIFLGEKKSKYSKVCNTQKCLRVGGKHNDFEDIGTDTYHHTFFEMLGNWSFNNSYGKREAIELAWTLLTKVYKLNKDRIYVTFFNGDPEYGLLPDLETRSIWREYLPADRVLPFGMKDNFWEMAETGPCGPSTEIHYSYLDEYCPHKVNKDDNDVIEIWNIVFTEFNRVSKLEFYPLENKFVDTGMGFERIVSVLQGKRSNYDTDIFQPIINKIYELTSDDIELYEETKNEQLLKGYRIVADHLRCLIVCISDGVKFSNNGRDYILRKVYRRAQYYCNYLFGNEFLLQQLLETEIVQKELCDYFDIYDTKKIFDQLEEERLKFNKTLKSGVKQINKIVKRTNTFTGDDMGKLYETFGFPPILTSEICKERGIEINMEEFEKHMKEHSLRSKPGL